MSAKRLIGLRVDVDTSVDLAGTQTLGFVSCGNLYEARQGNTPNVVRFALNAVLGVQPGVSEPFRKTAVN